MGVVSLCKRERENVEVRSLLSRVPASPCPGKLGLLSRARGGEHLPFSNAWNLDTDLSDILAPSTWQAFGVDQLILTRNDSTVDSFFGEECDAGDFPLHMTGIAETTNFLGNETTEYDFPISTYKGNPVITYLVPPDYDPAFAYCMLATGEESDKDILFIRDNFSGEGMMAFKRYYG